jgi:hypothetical protein
MENRKPTEGQRSLNAANNTLARIRRLLGDKTIDDPQAKEIQELKSKDLSRLEPRVQENAEQLRQRILEIHNEKLNDENQSKAS